ncbi:6,7-dimethyl-8-ribityllumazine synthase [Rickettsiales bacterium Ac37b]|nr:6,7-dimethyl-8-ribityllumazine synthase [Rickettsiales bacterium Ac37b]
MSIKIAIIVSKFNLTITRKLYQSTVKTLKSLDLKDNQINTIWVPGAIEIPITAKYLALTKQYQAIICLGVVIKGETSHFEYVCSQVSYGCQKLALEYTIPIIFGILTTYNIEQALARVRGKKNKGVELAKTALEMINVIHKIKDMP